MIYFDNAATTFPKPKPVIRELDECIKRYCGNAGRSSHSLSVLTSEKIYAARERIAHFLGVDVPEKIVFTQNATHALNLAIKTTVEPNSHILISDLEHNSVLRPIYTLTQSMNVRYSVFSSDENMEEDIRDKITSNTKYIISTLASNVSGREISICKLSKIAKKYNLCLIVDASQLIGHKRIDLSETPCDVLCAPGHKALFGIQGSGFALFLDNKNRETLFEGGSGNYSRDLNMPLALPERFEAGTLSAPSIVSLAAGIDFIEKIGISEIESKIKFLSDRLFERLLKINDIQTYEYENGVISFNFKGVSSSKIAYELDKYGICTRSGLHCAPLAHKTLGTLETGTVRVSLSYLNDTGEIDKLYKALLKIS